MFLFDWFWNLLSFFGWKSNAKLLIIGLDNAGKSTLLDRVASGKMLQHPPTSQCRSKELTLGSLNFTAYDLGGHRQARRVWRDYFPAVDGIIFMVDVADVERFPEARAELESLLHDDAISDIPILVLANKIDRKDAAKEAVVVNSLGLPIYRTGKELVNKSELPGRPLEVFPCSLLKMLGYGEGFRWLAHYVKQNETRKS